MKLEIVAGLALGLVSVMSAAGAQTLVFEDDFERGDAALWSDVFGAVPPDSFRIGEILLRDPHVFVDVPLAGCSDLTDTGFPLIGVPSVNESLAQSLNEDGDGDSFLDQSPLLLFRPLVDPAAGERVDLSSGLCTAPVAGTTCAPDTAAPPAVTSYTTQGSGLCLESLPGTTSGYLPAFHEPLAPCFATAAVTVTLDLQGAPITLSDARLGAELGPVPITQLDGGLMVGFLSETAADAILLPAGLPLVGGQPLSSLLPGGTGNCAPGDDRDLHDGESGWWFYLDFAAAEVPYSGP